MRTHLKHYNYIIEINNYISGKDRQINIIIFKFTSSTLYNSKYTVYQAYNYM